MFRSAFDDGFYVYSYIPAREKEKNYLFTQSLYNNYIICASMIMIIDQRHILTYLLVHCIFISHGKSKFAS